MAHILEPLAAIECQQQVFLLCRCLNAARVCQDNSSIVVAASHAVNHNAIQHTTLQVFLCHIKVRAGDAIVEDAFRNLHLRVLLLHRKQQLLEGDKGTRSNDFLKEERHACYGNSDDNERTHGLHQRHAGSLDSRQLRTFAQIAKSYQRRQQDSQGESLRHQHQTHIPEELRQHFHGKALANQLIDIAPQKLHHQHKLADEERGHEQQAKLFGYKQV